MQTSLIRHLALGLVTAAAVLAAIPTFAQPQAAAPPDETRSTATAYARPVTNVKIDGDLRDWPEDGPWYPLLTEYGVYGPTDVSTKDLRDNADMTARFAVAYDPDQQMLLLAMVVRDDVHVAGSSFNNTDGLELYVDGAPTPGVGTFAGRPPSCIQYAIVAGNGSYEPGGRNIMSLWATAANIVKLGYNRDEKTHTTTYEVAVPVFANLPMEGGPGERTKLVPGLRLWMDAAIADFDNDDIAPALVYWGPIAGMKYSSPEMLGDLVLLGGNEKLHTITGTAVQPDGSPLADTQLAFRSNDLPAGEVFTDDQGRFTFALPAGAYELSTSRVSGAVASKPLKFDVTDDGPNQAIKLEATHVAIPAVLQRAMDRYQQTKHYTDETHVAFSSNQPGGADVNYRFTFTTEYHAPATLRINADDGTVVNTDNDKMTITADGRQMAPPVQLDGDLSILDLARAWGGFPDRQKSLIFQNGHRTNGELPLGGAVGGLFIHKLFFDPDTALRHVQAIDVIGNATLNRQPMTMVQVVQPAADVFPGLPFGGFRRGVSTSLMLWIDAQGIIHQTRIRFDMAEIYPTNVGRRQSMPVFLLTAQHKNIRFDAQPAEQE